MIGYILRRIISSVPVALIASFVLFWAVRTTFDPLVKLRQSRDPELIARETERLGLDRPIPEQFVRWLKEFVAGNWGESTRTGGSVRTMIGDAVWPTLQLVLWAVLFGVVIAASVAVVSAVKRYSSTDNVMTGLSYLGISMPPFWVGLLLIQFLAIRPMELFGTDEPILYFVGLHSPGESGFGLDYLRHLVLPVITLTIALVASWSRYGRAAMLDSLSSDYIRTARAKGISRRRVIWNHAARNAVAPFLTVVCLDAALLFGGLVVTEQIYSIPGMGRLFLDSLQSGDVYVLVPWMLLVAVAVVVSNLLADLSYAAFDPRVRLR